MAEPSKVLKTRVMKDNRVVEDRDIKAGSAVSVGASAKNTFVLPDPALPGPEFVLFEPVEGGYLLRVTEAMNGTVQVGGAKRSLKKLRKEQAAGRVGDVWTVRLGEDDKGGVEVGGATILFKFEAPAEAPTVAPEAAIKSVEDVDLRPRLLEDDDPLFLGWLAIWCAMASVLVIFVWNTEPTELSLDELPDRFTKLVVEEAPPEVPEVEEKLEDPNALSASRKKESKQPAKERREETAEDRARRQEAARKEVLQQSKLLARLIGTTGENSRGVVENMWGEGDAGLGDIDGALGEVSGITTEGGPQLRSGEGVDGERAGIGELGGVESGNAAVAGGPKVVAKPTVSAGEGDVGESVGDAGSARATVKRNYGQLQYCYERVLRTDASLEGRVEVGWSVFGGKVEGAYVVANSTGSDDLADCIVKKIEMWTFPAGVEGDMSWPFVFRKQE